MNLTRLLRPRLSDCIVVWLLGGLCLGVPLLDRMPAHDTWWHLQTGRMIATTHSVPSTDVFSYTAHGQPWVIHEWLSLLLTWLVYARLGLAGLTVMKSLVIFSTFLVVFLTVRWRGSTGIAAISATAFAALLSMPGWSARPQVFGYLCFAILIWLIERSRRGASLWPAVPLFALWVNLHASWPVGIAVLVAFGAEIVWRVRFDGNSSSLRRFIKPLPFVVAALFLNPRPIAILGHPLHYFGPTRDPDFVAWQTFVSEWHSPNFHEPSFMVFATALLVLPVLLAVSQARVRSVELILVLGFAGASLYCQRHIPIFAIALAPLVADGVSGVARRLGKENTSEVEPTDSTALDWVVILALPFLIFAMFKWGPNPCREMKDYPVRSFDYLERGGRSGKLLTDYSWGGYAIFRLWPRYKVFVDGRADVYSGEIARSIRILGALEPGWRGELKKANPDAIVWPKKEPLAQALELLPEWRRVKLTPDDKVSVVFVPARARSED